ncbi:hypothetical protein SDC9_201875 [bioreactor metagenome]|uniref:Uncharacterized protein n=1 Tax=bioreactor metagenome TaxID=1076179 RepID=A0A645IS36_9ZZZZ
MPADGKKIDSLILYADRHLSVGLDSVTMQENFVSQFFFRFLLQFCNLVDRLDRTRLIVHLHDSYENSLPVNGIFQCGKYESAAFIHRQIIHLKPHRLQLAAAFQHSGMLYPGGNNLIAPSFSCLRGAKNSHIIGLCSAGSKEDFLFFSSQRRRRRSS